MTSCRGGAVAGSAAPNHHGVCHGQGPYLNGALHLPLSLSVPVPLFSTGASDPCLARLVCGTRAPVLARYLTRLRRGEALAKEVPDLQISLYDPVAVHHSLPPGSVLPLVFFWPRLLVGEEAYRHRYPNRPRCHWRPQELGRPQGQPFERAYLYRFQGRATEEVLRPSGHRFQGRATDSPHCALRPRRQPLPSDSLPNLMELHASLGWWFGLAHGTGP